MSNYYDKNNSINCNLLNKGLDNIFKSSSNDELFNNLKINDYKLNNNNIKNKLLDEYKFSN
jgi:hypothetical protein